MMITNIPNVAPFSELFCTNLATTASIHNKTHADVTLRFFPARAASTAGNGADLDGRKKI